MKLIKLTGSGAAIFWINPKAVAFVSQVGSSNPFQTHVAFLGERDSIKVKEPASQVVEMIESALGGAPG